MHHKKSVHYHFELQDGSSSSFDIELNTQMPAPPTPEEEASFPEWTRLSFHRCEACSYTKSNTCPIALKLREPAEVFAHLRSHETAKITVTTPDRSYVKETDVQEGLASMLGLMMSTTDCPITSRYFPVAWFHLPFSSFEETLHRLISGWMLKEYFNPKEKKTFNSPLEAVKFQCEQVMLLNKGIFHRLKEASLETKDAPFNAMAILDAFATMVPYSIDDKLEELRVVFTREVGE